MNTLFYSERFLAVIRKTLTTFGNLCTDLSDEAAHVWRDGGDGWTVTEILCHLRDFDVIFLGRARQMLDEENPLFIAYDHEQLAVERDYNRQNMSDVLSELYQSRQEMLTFFASLTAEQWERSGIHPEQGAWTMLHSVAQVATHDNNHIEQITRILFEKKS